MRQKLRQLIVSLGVIVALLVPLASVASVSSQASSSDAVCEGLGLTKSKTGNGCVDPQNTRTLSDVVATVINILSVVVGVIAVIMIIIGGLKYVISSGDPSNVSSAKNTILYAIVGLVIVALAQFIVRFVLKNAS